MTTLSPAAQAIVDQWITDLREGKSSMAAVAAALRVAATQPYDVPCHIQGDNYWTYRDGVEAERERNLAIAAELEAGP